MFRNTTQGLVFNRNYHLGLVSQKGGAIKTFVKKDDHMLDLFARMDALQADNDEEDEDLLDLGNFDIDDRIKASPLDSDSFERCAPVTDDYRNRGIGAEIDMM